MTKQEGAAIGFIIAGIVVGVLCLLGDIWGGPSLLHAFTWLGGFAVGYGVFTIILESRRRRL